MNKELKNTFVVSCPIDTFSGYGSRSRDFVRALIELDKYDVKIIPQRWGNTPHGFIEANFELWGFLNNHIIPAQLTEQPDIWCQITVPNEFQPVGKFNIGLTAGIETTACAAPWIEGCNRMNLNLVSSKHSKNVFINTKYALNNQQGQPQGELKLNKPIEVLMEGADLNVYKTILSKNLETSNLKKDLLSIKEDFAFLAVGHWMQGDIGEDRKNIGLLAKAFYEIFKNKKNPPALILKTSSAGTSYTDRREILSRLNHIRQSVDTKIVPSIYLLHGEFTDSEMNELYNHPKVKSMVLLTKGEGFGRPLLEFSLTNKPIITTPWSGHMDFLNADFTAMVAGKLKEIHPSAQVENMLIKGSQWFEPEGSQIAYYLNDVFDNYKTWKVKGKRQGHISRTNFSFKNMKDSMRTTFDIYIPEIPKKVEVVLPKPKKIELPTRKKLKKV